MEKDAEQYGFDVLLDGIDSGSLLLNWIVAHSGIVKVMSFQRALHQPPGTSTLLTVSRKRIEYMFRISNQNKYIPLIIPL